MKHSRPISRRSRQVILPLALFVALAAGWTALWFHASSVARASIAAWRAREAQSGRLYTCASENLGGYPFRIEVRCTEAGAQMRSADPPFVVKAKDLLVLAQAYRPNLLIAEVEAPLTFEAHRPASAGCRPPPIASRSRSINSGSTRRARPVRRPC